MVSKSRHSAFPALRIDEAADPTPSPRIGIAIFACTLLAFVAAALWLASVLNLYIDEAYSLHTTERGVAYALEQSIVFEQQPPLYFVALALWRVLDHSIFFARLTSIAVSIATLFVVFNFTRRYLRNLPIWLPAVVVATNPFFVWAAVELRVYAFIVLLTAAIVSLFFRAFLDERAGSRDYVAFLIISIIAMYTQYFFVATLIGLGFVVLLSEKRRIFAYSMTMCLTILALIPMFGIVRQQMHDASVEPLLNPRGLALQMISTMASFVLPHVWINALGALAINVAYAIVFLIMSIVVLRGIHRNPLVVALAVLTATDTAFFLFLILVKHEPIEMPRHITTLFVPTLLITVAGLSSEFGISKRRNVLALYLAIYTVCACAEFEHRYNPVVKIGDWTRVSRYLEMHAKPSEPIALFDAETALPMRYTFRGSSELVPIPHEQQFNGFDRRAFGIRDEHELAMTFPKASVQTGIVWLVVSRPCGYPELGNSCALLRDFIHSNFATLSVTQFYDTAVYELKLR